MTSWTLFMAKNDQPWNLSYSTPINVILWYRKWEDFFKFVFTPLLGIAFMAAYFAGMLTGSPSLGQQGSHSTRKRNAYKSFSCKASPITASTLVNPLGTEEFKWQHIVLEVILANSNYEESILHPQMLICQKVSIMPASDRGIKSWVLPRWPKFDYFLTHKIPLA